MARKIKKTDKTLSDSDFGDVNIVNIVLLAKFSDGKIRQVNANKVQQINILRLLQCTNENQKVNVSDKIIESIDWISDIDLR